MLSSVTAFSSTAGSSVVGPRAQSSVGRRHGRRSVAPTRSNTNRAAAKNDDDETSDAAFTPDADFVAVPRRTALATALACTLVAAAPTTPGSTAWADEGADASGSSSSSSSSFSGGTREFDFKTYKLTVPDVYEEVNVPLKDPATGVVSPTVMLLKDTRPGQAGNTISLSKQVIPEGGISTVADIGSAKETGERLVAAEAARKKGSGAAFRSASQRTGVGNELLYYTAEYTKSVLTVGRVVLTTLVVADGVLYTLTAEEDQGRFDGEMGDALRAAAASLEVISLQQKSEPTPTPAAADAKKRGGYKNSSRKRP